MVADRIGTDAGPSCGPCENAVSVGAPGLKVNLKARVSPAPGRPVTMLFLRSFLRIALGLALVLGLAPVALAFRAILAEGLARQAPAAATAALAVGATILPVLGISGLFANKPWALAL